MNAQHASASLSSSSPQPRHISLSAGHTFPPHTDSAQPNLAAALSQQPHSPAGAHLISSSPSSKPHPITPLETRRNSLSLSLPRFFFQPGNASSTSLVSSTAEGKPIPLDDSTAAHRTSALRKLNSNYPSAVSRHRYAKSTGAQSTTFSQPVIVRTHSGPSPFNTAQHSRQPSASRPTKRRIPLSTSAVTTGTFFSPASATRPIAIAATPAPTAPRSIPSRNGPSSAPPPSLSLGKMPRPKSKPKKKLPLPLPLPWPWGANPQADEAKLPPLEAFSFKRIMADLQDQDPDNDIGADLDRIAEICARSRYSLSNQYEVHVAPHGSGAGFAAGSSSGRRRGHHNHHQQHHQQQQQQQQQGGPTLQAIQSDDEEVSGRGHRKRRSAGARRKSVAYGTLETIMSSSRSSEEDKAKKKSAQEIAEEVRGRAARKKSSEGDGNGSGSSGRDSPDKKTQTGSGEAGRHQHSPQGDKNHGGGGEDQTLARRKSTSFATAVMDSSRHQHQSQQHPADSAESPRSSAVALLVSEPALPQTSNSHLEIRTAPDAALLQRDDGEFGHVTLGNYKHDVPQPHHHEPTYFSDLPLEPQAAEPRTLEPGQVPGGLLSGLSGWLPWRPAGGVGLGIGASGQHAKNGGLTGTSPSHAEENLRQLLKHVDGREREDGRETSLKGKSIERDL